MSSRGKKKTTMAKLNREARLRERRSEKKARKEARRDAASNPSHHDGMPFGEDHPFSEDEESPDTLSEGESAAGPPTPVSLAGPTRAR
jgi:hypothetical protein